MGEQERVTIVEVGPRDGLQNEAATVSLDDKLRLIDLLGAAGCGVIEAGAFVSPRWVPQMADSGALFERLEREGRKREGVAYPALAPNMRGFDAAMAVGVAEIAVFASASEGFSQRNLNCSIAESFARIEPVVEAARNRFVQVRGYVSCVVGCPIDGAVAPEQTAAVAEALMAMGCYEVSLGDTIGVGAPPSVGAVIEATARRVPVGALAGHFHDTYGMAIANVAASLALGVETFDSSVAGLGGCPFAPGATGNVATEDVVYLMNGLGRETGIDLDRLLDATTQISAVLGRPPQSRVARALLSKRQARAVNDNAEGKADGAEH